MEAAVKKDTRTPNVQGSTERKVETVDYRSSAGKGEELKNVQVTHEAHPTQNSNTSGGVLAGAAAAVVPTLESAKDAISGK